jgi:hypothetical protein
MDTRDADTDCERRLELVARHAAGAVLAGCDPDSVRAAVDAALIEAVELDARRPSRRAATA